MPVFIVKQYVLEEAIN